MEISIGSIASQSIPLLIRGNSFLQKHRLLCYKPRQKVFVCISQSKLGISSLMKSRGDDSPSYYDEMNNIYYIDADEYGEEKERLFFAMKDKVDMIMKTHYKADIVILTKSIDLHKFLRVPKSRVVVIKSSKDFFNSMLQNEQLENPVLVDGLDRVRYMEARGYKTIEVNSYRNLSKVLGL